MFEYIFMTKEILILRRSLALSVFIGLDPVRSDIDNIHIDNTDNINISWYSYIVSMDRK